MGVEAYSRQVTALATKSVMRMETNVGTRLISEDAILPGLGKVIFHKDAIANVLSLNELSTIYIVTMDTSKENAFIVHKNNCKLNSQRTLTVYTQIDHQKNLYRKFSIRTRNSRYKQ